MNLKIKIGKKIFKIILNVKNLMMTNKRIAKRSPLSIVTLPGFLDTTFSITAGDLLITITALSMRI